MRIHLCSDLSNVTLNALKCKMLCTRQLTAKLCPVFYSVQLAHKKQTRVLELWRQPYLHDWSGKTQGGRWCFFHKWQKFVTSSRIRGIVVFLRFFGVVAFGMVIGIATITAGSFAVTTRKTKSWISGKSVSLFRWLFIGLTVRRAEWMLDSFCGFDDLRKIFEVFCFKHQMFLNVWFRLGDKLWHDELRRVSVYGFAQFSEAVKVVFEAKSEAIDPSIL